MKNLKRPEQLELDAMSRADLCVLIMQLFDMLEKLDSRLARLYHKKLAWHAMFDFLGALVHK